MQHLQIHIYQKHPKVNFCIFVYIHFPLNIEFPLFFRISKKTPTKVYIQIVDFIEVTLIFVRYVRLFC
ncbi:hypothetical protein CN615_00970 [Bacillus pseudomycoides]|nr:hypothetical protein CN615_00970 [Bacillus pseudomycoides]